MTQLFETWPDPLLTVDGEGHPTGVNRALRVLFRDAQGRVPESLGDIDTEVLAALAEAEDWLSLRDVEGAEHHFRIQVVPTEGAELRCLRDVTREHEARMELERQQGATDASLKEPVTGLRNRRALLLALEPLVSLARRYDRPLSAVALDVLDREGRPLEDAALLAASHIVCDQTRWADVIAITDAHEFVVILPETAGEAASRLAAKLQTLLRQAGHEVVTGSAECRKTDDAASLVQRALSGLAEAYVGLFGPHRARA